MSQLYMPRGKAGSPTALLTAPITALSTTISFNTSILPDDVPNLVTIAYDGEIETVWYTAKDSEHIYLDNGGIRGFNGTTAKEFPSGATVARYISEYDVYSHKANIEEHEVRLVQMETGGSATIPTQQLPLDPPSDASLRYAWALARKTQKDTELAAWAVPEDPNVSSYTNVTTNGVVVNSASDQTSNIQLLVNSCADGSTLYFPAGNYVLNGWVEVPEGKVVNFVGGPGTIFDCTDHPGGAFTAFFTINNSTTRISNVKIYGLRFVLPAHSTVFDDENHLLYNGLSSYPFDIHLVNGLTIQYCSCQSGGYSFAKIDGCKDVVVENCWIQDIYRYGYGYGILLSSAKGDTDNVTIRHNFFTATNDDWHQPVAGGEVGTSFRHAVTTEGESVNTIRNVTITDNYFEGTREAAVDHHDDTTGPTLIDRNVFYSCSRATNLQSCLIGSRTTNNVVLSAHGGGGGFKCTNEGYTPSTRTAIDYYEHNFIETGAVAQYQIYHMNGRAIINNNVSVTTDATQMFILYSGTQPSQLDATNNIYTPDIKISGGTLTLDQNNVGTSTIVSVPDGSFLINTPTGFAISPFVYKDLHDTDIVGPVEGEVPIFDGEKWVNSSNDIADANTLNGMYATDFAEATHAIEHATGGSDEITPASIGAAPANHDHEEREAMPSLREYIQGLDPYEGEVNVACLTGLTTGEPDYQLAASPGRWFLSLDNRTRVRQDCDITSIQFYVGPSNMPTSFWFMVWRKNAAGTWDYIGGENVRSKMESGKINWINLDTPIPVKTGDYIGYGGIGTGMFLTPIPGATASATYYKNMAQPNGTYDWTTANTIETYLPLRAFGKPPVVVCIGDSITAGHPGNYSYIEASTTENPASDYPRRLANLTGVTVQNMGIGGQTSTQVAARFTTDCVYLRPRVAIIEVGLNDIQQGITAVQFVANITSMLEACRTSVYPIVPVFVGLPWTGATDEECIEMRGWFEQVRDLLDDYDDGTFVYGWMVLGDGLNRWDIKAKYDYGDQLHYNADGYAALTIAVLAARVGMATQ